MGLVPLFLLYIFCHCLCFGLAVQLYDCNVHANLYSPPSAHYAIDPSLWGELIFCTPDQLVGFRTFFSLLAAAHSVLKCLVSCQWAHLQLPLGNVVDCAHHLLRLMPSLINCKIRSSVASLVISGNLIQCLINCIICLRQAWITVNGCWLAR